MWPPALTRKPEPVDARSITRRGGVTQRARYAAGRPHRAFQFLRHPAVHRQPGHCLESLDRGAGPRAGNAVGRAGIVAEPGEIALQSGDAALILCIARRRPS